MSLKPLLSFSSGELDPVLTDNVTLEKFNKGLATGRNILIGKTGSMYSRFSTYHLIKAKLVNRAVKIYSPPNTAPSNSAESSYLIEWGHEYVRIHEVSIDANTPGACPLPLAGMLVELSHVLTEDDLPKIHFTTSKEFVYIFCADKTILKLKLDAGSSAFIPEADIFEMSNPLLPMTVTAVGTPTGYKVDYLMTLIINGEESLSVAITTGYNKPIAAGQSNVVHGSWVTAGVTAGKVREVRVYSRPNGGGAYGLLGTTDKFTIVGANTFADFADIGSLPDFGNGTQDLVTKYGLNGDDPILLLPVTGLVYQQRLLQVPYDEPESIIASRPGFHNNYYRDFPNAADSALLFKAGTSGRAKILRLLESDGIVAFTTNGVYTNSGLLGPNNLALERRGPWVISETIPPLVVPGGVFFVDRNNTIRQLVFSQEILAYESVEQSIFSNHLFKDRTINSWGYQDGFTPVIIVTFTDGDFATFTYNYEHQMRAWTRHDSQYPIEQIEGSDKLDRTYFVVNKTENRYISMSLPRVVPRFVRNITNQWDLWCSTSFMDAMVSKSGWLNPYLVGYGGAAIFFIDPVVPGVWDGQLNVINLAVAAFPDIVVGSILRFFHPIDKTTVDLEVLTVDGTFSEWTVMPSSEYPEEYSTNPDLYETYNVIDGLAHLEGETVSVMVDGSLVASPLNDDETYPVLTVTGGQITLPGSLYGAIIQVGRPIVADIKTLNISTVEQSPTLIESINVNKVYVRVNESRGLYCDNKFPEEAEGEVDGTGVAGMGSLDEALVPTNGVILGNTYFKPVNRRCEVSIQGTWSNQGQISIRQVDPFHFEILSIIPDVTVEKRTDK